MNFPHQFVRNTTKNCKRNKIFPQSLQMFFFCLLFFYLVSCEFIKVDPETQAFVDENNRQMFFHGVNAVYKMFPYHPEYKVFSANLSLTDGDAGNLRKWGFNMVRLYVAWEGTEIGPGQYNDTYLNEVKKIVDILSQHGIYTLLDCHQDVFSRYYCGEGIPDFYVEELHPSMKFPRPVPGKMDFDPVTGYPKIQDCLKKNFADYYLSDAVSSGFQELYTKGSNLYDGFMDFWSHVSNFFKNEEFVLGYELLNEPWSGNIYKDPLLLIEPGKTDREFLTPMYNDLFSRINVEDENHLVFFEPAVVEIGHSGFGDSCPFPTKDRCVFSYHVYCGIVDEKGSPDFRIVCDFVDDLFIDLRTKDWKNMKTPGVFVTEFGALYNDSKSVTELHWVLGQLEKRLTSWSYWQFKYFNDYTTADHPGTVESFYSLEGVLEVDKVKALSRTYALRTCGRAVSNDFDPDTDVWEYTFQVGDCNGEKTVVFLNEEWNYPLGYSVTMKPDKALNVTKGQEKNYIQLEHADWVKEGTQITVTIAPKTK